jgi:hypothetical protein
MAKVKLIGDLNVEFDVKFNQTEDVVIETKAINVDGKTIYVGKGDIEKINPKAFSFIMDRIEYFLKKNNAHVLNIYAIKDDDINTKLINIIDKEKIEPLKTILTAYRFRESKAVQRMLQDGWFLLSREGVKKYADRYYENKNS